MIAWLAPGDPPESFPPVDRALREPPGLLAAGGDLSSRAAPGRLPARHIPLVFPGPAGAVVVARPARGAVSGGIPSLQEPRPGAAHPGLRISRGPGLPGGAGSGCARAARREVPAPGSPPICTRPTWSCTAWASPTAPRSGAPAGCSAACTASDGPRVLRGIHVQRRARRLEGGPGRPGAPRPSTAA